jgi:hypothetical protein
MSQVVVACVVGAEPGHRRTTIHRNAQLRPKLAQSNFQASTTNENANELLASIARLQLQNPPSWSASQESRGIRDPAERLAQNSFLARAVSKV